MKECKICSTKAVVNSEIISGLCCCRMCGKFFLEGMVADSMLSVGQILREEIKLSGYKDTLLAHDSIHVAAQLKYIDPVVLNAYTVVLDNCGHVILKLMRLSQDRFDHNTKTEICHVIESDTGLNSSIVSFIVDTYTYALKLTDVPVEYLCNDRESLKTEFKINYFKTEKRYIKEGESTCLTWKISNAGAVVSISDGLRQWNVPSTGSMTVTPSVSSSYTITAVYKGMVCNSKSLSIYVVKPIVISQFTTSSQDIYEGQTLKVSWDVSNADYVGLLVKDGKKNSLCARRWCAWFVGLLVKDGKKNSKIEDVTNLNSKELKIFRDCEIILVCKNSCYTCQNTIKVNAKPLPRFSKQSITCANSFKTINIQGPVIPTFGYQDNLLSKRLNDEKLFERLQGLNILSNLEELLVNVRKSNIVAKLLSIRHRFRRYKLF